MKCLYLLVTLYGVVICNFCLTAAGFVIYERTSTRPDRFLQPRMKREPRVNRGRARRCNPSFSWEKEQVISLTGILARQIPVGVPLSAFACKKDGREGCCMTGKVRRPAFQEKGFPRGPGKAVIVSVGKRDIPDRHLSVRVFFCPGQL